MDDIVVTSEELSIDAGPTDPPLLEETIGDNLARTIARSADRDALVESFTGRRWTWAEFGAEVDRTARALLALGIGTGDRVGIWSPNRAEWVLVQYATARIGVVLVNINPAYRTHELSYALNQSGCVAVIASDAFRTSDYPAMIESVRGELPDLRHVVIMEPVSWSAFLAGADAVDPARYNGSAKGCHRTTRSTSSTPPAPPVTPRAPRSATGTS
ncbi:AMP-binding protein [Naumannella halotolerans]|uniref:AMP-binding protein n=1 Tax=Naumannella halotolerans TaxID=993414 RepID=UPI0024445B92|nr:AMP-binding protein [Naumannella halotolerans]